MKAPDSPSTLAELLERRARDDRDRLAFAARDAAITYGMLRDEAGAIAAALHDLGVRARDRVALSLPAGLSFVRAFWALQLLGAASCALNPHTPPASIVRRAARARPRLLVTDDASVAHEAHAAGVDAILFGALARSSARLPRCGITGEEIAVLQTTSGTSGEPRIAMIRHRNVLLSAAAAAEALGFGTRDVLVTWVPPWHDLGLVRFIIGGVFFGAPCHIVAPAIRTIPEWLQTIGRARGTVTSAPDFAYRLATRLVDPSTVRLASLRIATNGGEPVRRSTIESFEAAFGVPGVMLPGYGLAEATLGVTCMLPGEPRRFDARGNVSCGRALPGIELRIDDGEIVAGGPFVFAGYLDADDATRAALRDDQLHTGDIGHLDDDGHLYVLGRKRAMLKRGGAVLAPRELEEAAQSVAGVKIAAAVGVPSERATEEIVVAVEIDDGDDAARVTREVASAVHDALGFAPERVLAMRRNAIPRTYNGKLRHEALRQGLIDGSLDGSTSGAIRQ